MADATNVFGDPITSANAAPPASPAAPQVNVFGDPVQQGGIVTQQEIRYPQSQASPRSSAGGYSDANAGKPAVFTPPADAVSLPSFFERLVASGLGSDDEPPDIQAAVAQEAADRVAKFTAQSKSPDGTPLDVNASLPAGVRFTLSTPQLDGDTQAQFDYLAKQGFSPRVSYDGQRIIARTTDDNGKPVDVLADPYGGELQHPLQSLAGSAIPLAKQAAYVAAGSLVGNPELGLAARAAGATIPAAADVASSLAGQAEGAPIQPLSLAQQALTDTALATGPALVFQGPAALARGLVQKPASPELSNLARTAAASANAEQIPVSLAQQTLNPLAAKAQTILGGRGLAAQDETALQGGLQAAQERFVAGLPAPTGEAGDATQRTAILAANSVPPGATVAASLTPNVETNAAAIAAKEAEIQQAQTNAQAVIQARQAEDNANLAAAQQNAIQAVRGSTAAAAQGVTDAQRATVNAANGAINGIIPPTLPNDAAVVKAVKDALPLRAADYQQQVDANFQEAHNAAAGEGITVKPGPRAQALIQSIGTQFPEDIGQFSRPVAGVQAQAKALVGKVAEGEQPALGLSGDLPAPSPAAATAGEIIPTEYTPRQAINLRAIIRDKLADPLIGGVESGQLKQLYSVVDGAIQDAVGPTSNASQEVKDLYANAFDHYRETAGDYKDPIVTKLSSPSGQPPQIPVNTVLPSLLNGTSAGGAGDINSLLHLRNVLGENSPEYTDLKAALARRITTSGGPLADTIGRLNPEFAQEVFGDQLPEVRAHATILKSAQGGAVAPDDLAAAIGQSSDSVAQPARTMLAQQASQVTAANQPLALAAQGSTVNPHVLNSALATAEPPVAAATSNALALQNSPTASAHETLLNLAKGKATNAFDVSDALANAHPDVREAVGNLTQKQAELTALQNDPQVAANKTLSDYLTGGGKIADVAKVFPTLSPELQDVLAKRTAQNVLRDVSIEPVEGVRTNYGTSPAAIANVLGGKDANAYATILGPQRLQTLRNLAAVNQANSVADALAGKGVDALSTVERGALLGSGTAHALLDATPGAARLAAAAGAASRINPIPYALAAGQKFAPGFNDYLKTGVLPRFVAPLSQSASVAAQEYPALAAKRPLGPLVRLPNGHIVPAQSQPPVNAAAPPVAP